MSVTVPPLSEFEWNGTEAQQEQRAEDSLEPLIEVARQNWAKLSEYAQAGVTSVTTKDCNDPWVCPACQALRGKVYPIDRPPVLPLRECTSETGCRCSYSPSVE